MEGQKVSGIYIPGMEMPKTCQECCLESFCNLWIEAIKMSGVELKVGAKATIRHPDCPLVPVPPHGDLIDRDALPWEKQGKMLTDPDEWGIEARYIEAAPTIIPASGGTDNE